MKTRNSKDGPLVSVIMAALNAERYIGQSIESVLNQTYSNFELIVYDDGSHDSTASIVRRFTDKRIRFISGTENFGVSVARNKCIELSCGEYIAVLDADDIWDERKIEIQLGLMENKKKVSIVGSFIYEIDESGHVVGKRDYPKTHVGIVKKKPWECPFLHSSVLFRSTFGVKYREDLKQAEDWELFSRLLDRGLGANVPERLVYYRVHPSNLTNSRSKEQSVEAFKAVKSFRELRFMSRSEADLFYSIFSYDLNSISQPVAALFLMLRINIKTKFNIYSRRRLWWVLSYAFRYITKRKQERL